MRRLTTTALALGLMLSATLLAAPSLYAQGDQPSSGQKGDQGMMGQGGMGGMGGMRNMMQQMSRMMEQCNKMMSEGMRDGRGGRPDGQPDKSAPAKPEQKG